MTGQPRGTVAWALHGLVDILAIFGGLLSCLMSVIVAVSVADALQIAYAKAESAL